MSKGKKEKTSTPLPKKENKVWAGTKTVLVAAASIVCFSAALSGISNYASPDEFTTAEDIEQQFTVVETEGGTYFGSLREAAYAGMGEFQYFDGGVYEGEFTESKREGTGTFTWPNGDSFTGTWHDDKMDEGVYTFSSGAVFEGNFTESGFGDGDYDLGSCCDSKGFTSYKAEVSDGEISSVEFTLPSGTVYKGELTGTADIKYPSGNQYSGDVVSGVRSGYGKFTWKDKNGQITAYYEGTWKNDVMQGSGAYHFSSSIYPYISGNFVNGHPDGTAVYYKEADNTFSTTWSNGRCSKVKET